MWLVLRFLHSHRYSKMGIYSTTLRIYFILIWVYVHAYVPVSSMAELTLPFRKGVPLLPFIATHRRAARVGSEGLNPSSFQQKNESALLI